MNLLAMALALTPYVTCGGGKLNIDKLADGTFAYAVSDAAVVADWQQQGWIRPDEVGADGVFRKAAARSRGAYRYFGSPKEAGGTFVEFRWDEGSNPPSYAFIELWRVLDGGELLPLTTWDFRDGSCTFAETEGNFDLRPAPLPAYEPTHEYDAHNCELFVNSLGLEHRHYGGGGYDEMLLASYVSIDKRSLVDEQGGKILKVGVRLNGKDDVVSTQEFEPAYYLLSKSLWLRGWNTGDYDLHYFAYFVDVQRAGGEVDRLWLKDGAKDFDWPQVFDGYPAFRKDLGSGYDEYVQDPSPIYAQKHACGR